MATSARASKRQAAKKQLSESESDEEIELEPETKSRKGSGDTERSGRKKGAGKGEGQPQEIVRVWWEPTQVKSRTGFAGAYWPAKVLKKGQNYLQVQYDNGESEKVDPDNIFPYEVPIDFGKEAQPLEAGEFVEVSNNSKTDPCAWVGVIASVGKKYLIDYPFHDSPSEYIKPELLRRARVWDDLDWKYIEVGQRWKAGEITSPIELNLMTEDEYFEELKQMAGSSGKGKGKRAAAAAAADSSSSSDDDDKDDEGEGSSEEEPQQRKQSSSRKRARTRKPVHPTRASMDEVGNGSGDKKNDRPKGAKKRKPAAVRQAPKREEDAAKEQQPAPPAVPKAAAIEVVAGTTSARRKAAQKAAPLPAGKQPAAKAPAAADTPGAHDAAVTVDQEPAAGTSQCTGAAVEAAAVPEPAAATPVAAAVDQQAAASAAALPGSAVAPVTLTQLMQGLSQPVLLLPASSSAMPGQQQPMMLLLPKGTSAAGLGTAVPVSAASLATMGLAGVPGAQPGQDSSINVAAKLPLKGSGLPSAAFAEVAAGAATAGQAAAAAAGGIAPVVAPSAAAVGALELEAQLSQLDLTAARLALAKQYTTEAFLLLLDCWRADSPKSAVALRSFRANVLGNPQPDYHAFMVGIFGIEKMKSLALEQCHEGVDEQQQGPMVEQGMQQ